MKFNKWTLGLAAIGVVSLASAARADEKVNFTQTALTGTTISGYVDTSMQWNLGTGNDWVAPVSFQNSSKADGFNLNVVQLTINKPLDESEWAAGYHVDLWFGPDANSLGTQSSGTAADLAIRQAYVNLRTPVGNGIDWKIGVFDTVIGYESLDATSNPNYTRSYGFTIEPTTHTGVLGTYRINDMISVNAGIANTVGPMINDRAFLQGGNSKAESYKTYMGSVALTAPKSWGWAEGSTFYLGIVNGFSSAAGENVSSYYAGATVATPVAGLKVGGSLDYLSIHNSPYGPGRDHDFAAALYASYQATEKLGLNLRAEYWDDTVGIDGDFGFGPEQFYAVTTTAQYDLWKNVISRIEFRWDHAAHGLWFGGNPNSSTESFKENAFMLAANIIYKF